HGASDEGCAPVVCVRSAAASPLELGEQRERVQVGEVVSDSRRVAACELGELLVRRADWAAGCDAAFALEVADRAVEVERGCVSCAAKVLRPPELLEPRERLRLRAPV